MTGQHGEFNFDGPSLTGQDTRRLGAQHQRVFGVMRRGAWFSLAEISAATGAPEASVSARLRDLRKRRFGSYLVDRRRREGEEERGTWEYQLTTREGFQV